MDRRDFLKSTGAAAAALAATATQTQSAPGAPLAAPASIAKPRDLVLAMPWRPAVSGFADDALRLARRIETMSEGALRIELVPMTGSRAPDGALRVVPLQSRVADHPGFAYVAGLPGATALAPGELAGWLRDAGGQDLLDELAEAQNVKALLAGHSGADLTVWSRRPIETAQDIAGVRIFARGLASDVARALGAEPVALGEADAEIDLTSPDILRAAAAEWGSLTQADAIGLPGAMPYAMAGLLSPQGATTALEIPLPLWRAFSGLERSALAAAANLEFLAAVEQDRTVRSLSERALQARNGTQIQRPAPELAAARDRVAAAVVAHAAGFDATSARIDRSYMAYLRILGRKGAAGGQHLS